MKRQEKLQLAIFHGKQGINIAQDIRHSIKNFDKNLEKSFLKKIESDRTLARIFIADGRLPEAQSILDLLKEEEYEKLILRRSGQNPETFPYNKAEVNLINQVESLATLERNRAELLIKKEQNSLC